MFKYIAKRLALAVLTLIIITIVTYLLVARFSKNPYEVDEENGLMAMLTKYPNLTKDEALDRLNTIHHLNDPLLVRLWNYISGIFQNNWGEIYSAKNNSFSTHIPTMFFGPLKWTVIITLPAFVISAILGVLFGIWSGYKRGTWVDSVINLFSLFFVALPSFVLAPIVIRIALTAGIPSQVLKQDGINSMSDIIKSYIPVITLVTLSSLVVYITYTRNMIISVMNSNYVLIARSKGLSQTQIFFKYVLRNISIPLSAIILPSYIGLLSGSIVIETYWNVPGTSMIITQSFPSGEVNIVMFNVLFFTTLSLFTTILVDISFVILDPRIKYAPASPNSWTRLIQAYFKRKKAQKLFAQTNTIKGDANE